MFADPIIPALSGCHGSTAECTGEEKWSTGVDLELVLHKSNVRVKATVAVVNAKMESGEDSFDGKPSVGLISRLFSRD